jgi:DNA mismatch endonuclease (patch repair protein)
LIVAAREYSLGWYLYDFAFADVKVLLEVQGCYWHGCSKHFPNPTKAQMNQQRLDKSKQTYAENRGWSVVYVWEHDLNLLLEEKGV